MKIIIFSLLVIFCSVFSFAQNIASPPGTLPSQVPITSKVDLNADRDQFASIENTTYNEDYYMNNFRKRKAIDQCDRNQKRKIKGIILTAIGGVLIIPGIALVVNGVYNPDYASNGLNDIVGGVFLLGAGVGCLGPGIPLTIIGTIKTKKYCTGSHNTSYIEVGTNGNSLALNF